MPAVETLSYHVAGPVLPQAEAGLDGAYVVLGVCEEGADIALQQAVHDVKHDGAGGQDGFEAENIILNAAVTCRFSLVPYGGFQINQLRGYAQGNPLVDSEDDGIMPMPGNLFGFNGLLPGLYLPTFFDPDGPWTFTNCRVVNPGSNRVSTKEVRPQFEFRAFNYVNPAENPTILGNVLYKRSAP